MTGVPAEEGISSDYHGAFIQNGYFLADLIRAIRIHRYASLSQRDILVVGHLYLGFPYCIQNSVLVNGKCGSRIVLYRSIRRRGLIGVPSLKGVALCLHASLIENRYRASTVIRVIVIRL